MLALSSCAPNFSRGGGRSPNSLGWGKSLFPPPHKAPLGGLWTILNQSLPKLGYLEHRAKPAKIGNFCFFDFNPLKYCFHI